MIDFEKDYRSADWAVRRYVAKNPNCPLHILELLSRDEEYYVRRAVTRNPKCPEAIKVAFILEN